MKIQGYRDLLVWQKAVDLIEEIYRLSRLLPPEERFVLSDQLRRAALSVSNNIAEGSGRGTTPDLRNFLSTARGSVKETESMLLVSERLRFLKASQTAKALALTDEVSRMLWSLRASLGRKSGNR
jgi:four helix bundle protein